MRKMSSRRMTMMMRMVLSGKTMKWKRKMKMMDYQRRRRYGMRRRHHCKRARSWYSITLHIRCFIVLKSNGLVCQSIFSCQTVCKTCPDTSPGSLSTCLHLTRANPKRTLSVVTSLCTALTASPTPSTSVLVLSHSRRMRTRST